MHPSIFPFFCFALKRVWNRSDINRQFFPFFSKSFTYGHQLIVLAGILFLFFQRRNTYPLKNNNKKQNRQENNKIAKQNAKRISTSII